jgi:hypothetical protein
MKLKYRPIQAEPNRRMRVAALATVLSLGIYNVAQAGPGNPALPAYSEPTVSSRIQIGSSQSWYEGGTLHAATLREWTRASRANQLATAADWAVGILGGAKARQIGKEGWRVYANGLVTCINTAAVPDMMDQSVSELATACSILMEMQ